MSSSKLLKAGVPQMSHFCSGFRIIIIRALFVALRSQVDNVPTPIILGNRSNRSVDYPGLAFGSAMFGSDTMMKFNIIKNELHNIMRSQLKRVDGEVSAMAQRIKALDDNLALSEQYIKTATATLAEAVQVCCWKFLVHNQI